VSAAAPCHQDTVQSEAGAIFSSVLQELCIPASILSSPGAAVTLALGEAARLILSTKESRS